MTKPIAEFDGGYGRTGRIWVEVAVCVVCKEQRKVVSMDGSENEYECGAICLGCAIRHLMGGIMEFEDYSEDCPDRGPKGRDALQFCGNVKTCREKNCVPDHFAKRLRESQVCNIEYLDAETVRLMGKD